jgi:hypothetical protein
MVVGRRERPGEMDNEWLSSEETRKNFIAKYNDGCQSGLYGWRRRCLFLVLIILLLLVIINLALTLWILKVMEFSAVSPPHSLQHNLPSSSNKVDK